MSAGSYVLGIWGVRRHHTFMPKTLREYKVKFERVQSGQQAISVKALGLMSKLGGEPDWVQGDETPVCSGCGQPLSFVGQIDSIEHDESHNPHAVDCLSDEQEYMFGDVGMFYIFFCFDCMETKSVFQCG
jgi:uncharacterized protein YwqG